MADLQTRLSALITAIGTDIKKLNYAFTTNAPSSPTPQGYAAHNFTEYTGINAALTIGAPALLSNPNGNRMTFRMLDNGTARALTWNAAFRSLDTVNIPLPTTTVAGKWMYVGFIYNSFDGTWDLVSIVRQT